LSRQGEAREEAAVVASVGSAALAKADEIQLVAVSREDKRKLVAAHESLVEFAAAE